MGAELVIKTVEGLREGSLKARPQEDFIKNGIPLKTAPRIRKEDCRINWNRPAAELYNFIRGLSPFPGAYSYLETGKGKRILWKIYDSDVEPAPHPYEPGILITDGKNELKASTADGFLHIREVQQEGKKKMRSGDFLRGISLPSGECRFF
jgi:methionyl-tRNA formyltransferase